MKILLLGKNGQLGWELQRSLSVLGNVIALGSTPENGLCGNLADETQLRATIRRIAPDVIVNAGAYTAVDKAETETELAMRINGHAPGILAEEAKRLDAWLVHYSTDYVFDGSGQQAWREIDEPRPLNVYGHTKLIGERALQATWHKHLIFRTSWVHGLHGNNFMKIMLRLGHERESLSVVNDQFGAPTSASLLAGVTVRALITVQDNADAAGLYHLAAAGETNWFDYARCIFRTATESGISLRVGADDLIPIPSSAYHTPAMRPKNSRLDTARVKNMFGLVLPHWEDDVVTEVRALCANA